MAGKSKQVLEQAEAKFRKRAASGPVGAQAERHAVQDKIARLRALRLAKEEADRQAAAKPAVKATR